MKIKQGTDGFERDSPVKRMDAALYQQFLSLKNAGWKAEAKATLALFIASFATWEEKQNWVYSFLESTNFEHRIRHEIYEHLVYPVLLDGYLKSDVNCITWLAHTALNLLQIESLHPALQGKGAYALFMEAYRRAPNEKIRVGLLNTLLRGFDYSQHEWPVGILDGVNGTDIKGCEEILEDIAFARTLDTQNQHASYLSDYESKVREYHRRLRERD